MEIFLSLPQIDAGPARRIDGAPRVPLISELVPKDSQTFSNRSGLSPLSYVLPSSRFPHDLTFSLVRDSAWFPLMFLQSRPPMTVLPQVPAWVFSSLKGWQEDFRIPFGLAPNAPFFSARTSVFLESITLADRGGIFFFQSVPLMNCRKFLPVLPFFLVAGTYSPESLLPR